MEILAHRGGCAGRFPENSIRAFGAGLAAGADRLELDVHLTADGSVVVHHDPTLYRTCGCPLAIRAESVATICSQPLLDDAGGPSEDRIPLLGDVVDAFPHTPLNIDIKGTEPALVDALVRLLERSGAAGRSIVGSFHPRQLQLFRSRLPAVRTSAHPGEVKRLLLARIVAIAPPPDGRIVQVPVRHGAIPIVTRGFVRYLHRLGRTIHVWTVNDGALARRLAAIGVDGLVTDRVAEIRAALAEGQ